MPEFNHVSVLKEELTDGIITDKNGIYCDMTLGGAGHSRRLLELTDKAKLLGIDRDPLALSVAKERLSEFGERVILYHGNFSEIDLAADKNGIDGFDGIMADLGVSSPQLDDAERGFSYMHDAPLDMRMDTTSDFSAYDVVNGYSENELMRIIEFDANIENSLNVFSNNEIEVIEDIYSTETDLIPQRENISYEISLA